MIRVLIVDDQPGVREGMSIILRTQPDIEVVGERASGPEAVAAVDDLQPDVVLMDVRMPGGDGLAATRELTRLGRERTPAVVMMTSFVQDDYLFGALEAGASGFLVKNSDATELAAAVYAAARGEAMVSPAVTRRLLATFVRPPVSPPSLLAAVSDEQAVALTDRERDILRGVSAGLSNPEIGEQLQLSMVTVRSHISRLLAKTKSANRVQLAIWAYRHDAVT